MGNNNYQFRLESLDILDEYRMKLQQEENALLGYPMKLKQIHEEFADADKWNDIKHTMYFEEELNEVIQSSERLRENLNKAMERLTQLKAIYSQAGVR
jgi:hypothetical protein